jgi:hypothetical protein
MTLVTVTLPLGSVMEKSGVSLRPALPDCIHSRRRTTRLTSRYRSSPTVWWYEKIHDRHHQ